MLPYVYDWHTPQDFMLLFCNGIFFLSSLLRLNLCFHKVEKIDVGLMVQLN
jgi:hypothetical protein